MLVLTAEKEIVERILRVNRGMSVVFANRCSRALVLHLCDHSHMKGGNLCPWAVNSIPNLIGEFAQDIH